MVFSGRRLIQVLIVLNFILLICYVLAFRVLEIPSYTFNQWFDIDSEHNLPTYLSSLQLLIVALLSAWRGEQRASGDPAHLVRFYRVMAGGFLFLSVDEVAQIHEGLTILMANLGVNSPFPGGFGIWILIYPLLALGLLLLVWRGFRAFLAQTSGRSTFFLGVCCYLGGGVLVELGSYFFASPGEASQFYFVLVEESLEVAGQILMVAGLLERNRDSVLSLSGGSALRE
ncbi:MAG: hypothetical protein HKO65_13690 [Gemmatimonadetes bacterium]|nr:hypothetical protein [Gemmatimonadota bacterium]